MPTAINSILNRYFRKIYKYNGPYRGLYVENGSTYEKQLLSLDDDITWIKVPEKPVDAVIVGLDFDFVLSQSRTNHYDRLYQIARMLHVPLISLETQPFPQNGDVSMKHQSASVHVVSSELVASQWEVTDIILEPIEPIAVNFDQKNQSYVAVDADQQTAEIARQLSQHWNLQQIPNNNPSAELEGFKNTLIYLNLAGSITAVERIRKAVSCGCIVSTWNHPTFNELVVDGVTGYTGNSPNEITNKMIALMNNPAKMLEMHEATKLVCRNKFSVNGFRRKWVNLITSTINKGFLGDF